MILIEMLNDTSKEILKDVPKYYHKKLLSLYEEALLKNRKYSNLIKIRTFDLIKLKFINNNYRKFRVEKLLVDFEKFCSTKKEIDKDEIRFGYQHDIDRWLWIFLSKK